MESKVLTLLDEIAARDDVPADVRERAQALADARRPSPETVRLVAEFEELAREWGEG